EPAHRNQNPEDDRLRPWRTPRNVDIDREDPVHSPGARVTLPDDAAGRRARTHGDHDAWTGDRLDRAAHRGFQVARHRPGDNDAVRVARRGNEVDAEAANVVHRIQQRGELPVARVARTRVEVP